MRQHRQKVTFMSVSVIIAIQNYNHRDIIQWMVCFCLKRITCCSPGLHLFALAFRITFVWCQCAVSEFHWISQFISMKNLNLFLDEGRSHPKQQTFMDTHKILKDNWCSTGRGNMRFDFTVKWRLFWGKSCCRIPNCGYISGDLIYLVLVGDSYLHPENPTHIIHSFIYIFILLFLFIFIGVVLKYSPIS